MHGPPTWTGSPERHASHGPLPQPAAVGALAIYVDGHRNSDVSKILFGLNLLRDGSPNQIDSAIQTLEAGRHATRSEIESMLERR